MKRRSFMGCVAALLTPIGLLKSNLPKLTGEYGYDPGVLIPGGSFVVVDLSDGPVNTIASDGTPLCFTSKGPEQCYLKYGTKKIVPDPCNVAKLKDILNSNIGGGITSLTWGPELNPIQHIPLTLKSHNLEEFVTACQKAYPRTTLEFYEICYTTKPNRNYDCYRYSNIYCRSIPVWNTPPVNVKWDNNVGKLIGDPHV